LRPDSLAVDAADPQADYSQEEGFNGSRADMGALGNTPYAPENPQLDQVQFTVKVAPILTARPGEDVTYVLTLTNQSPVTESYSLYGEQTREDQFSWQGISYYYKSNDYTGEIKEVGPLQQVEQKLVAHIPHYATNDDYNILSLRIQGSYTGAQSLQLVTDVAYPSSVEQVGHLGLLPRDVLARDSYLYVAAGQDGLRILDISNLARPKEVGFYNTPDNLLGDFSHVQIEGNYAYLAAGLAGMRVVDISNPVSPTEVSAYEPGGYTQEVQVTSGYAYIKWSTCYNYTCEEAIRIVDVSKPAALAEVALYPWKVD
jgi:hypothetical protein